MVPADHDERVQATLDHYAAQYPETRAMGDAVLVLSPVLAELSGQPSTVTFPGTPHPTECWVKAGALSAGVFLQGSKVRVVVWVRGEMQFRMVERDAEPNALSVWARSELLRQRESGADAPQPNPYPLPTDALPPPSLEHVLARLKAGAKVTIATARHSEIYFFEGEQLMCDWWDEGYTQIGPMSVEALKKIIERDPDPFRNL